uniref:IncF plasmid conjugative transfer pilus assemblyprotein TraB n=1 Tax=Vibrio tasmaniensis TaxID=212663 RepID=A0A0H3ZQI3_9VIBR|nr:IncF plasmid conjugative transfer pilus assemblyprotein TraB [Vibrio tasmaniensis]
MFDKLKERYFTDREGDFDQGGAINDDTAQRNKRITTVAVSVLCFIVMGVWMYARPKPVDDVEQVEPVEFGAIVDQGFTEKDNQSALSQQQLLIATLQKQMREFQEDMTELEAETQRRIAVAKTDTASLVEDRVRSEMQDKVDGLQRTIEEMKAHTAPPMDTDYPFDSEQERLAMVGGDEVFGQAKLPPRPSISSDNNPDIDTMSYQPRQQRSFVNSQFDSTDFSWAEDEEQARRTTDNFVPTGTFVTALVTGGADANAGVMGQGDTTPIVFQTMNQGVLPNGKPSKLKDCTVTGAVYGEISSSRGIVRTNRLSCILENDEILDVPVKGTAFNFGRNGIRGTTILKNGKVVQMAGISGILTGLGEAGKGASQTTSTSALGTTSSVSGKDFGLNLLGNATASVGAKLADYYIGLAEMYHPIVEINPGSMVNIVFLEGFPLDPLEAAEYEQSQKEDNATQSNQVMEVISSVTQNPLANQINAQGIQVPRSPFGQQ